MQVRDIKRLREKRAFEAQLPPLVDQASLEVRRRMLEEQELKDWKYREEAVRPHQRALAQRTNATPNNARSHARRFAKSRRSG